MAIGGGVAGMLNINNFYVVRDERLQNLAKGKCIFPPVPVVEVSPTQYLSYWYVESFPGGKLGKMVLYGVDRIPLPEVWFEVKRSSFLDKIKIVEVWENRFEAITCCGSVRQKLLYNWHVLYCQVINYDRIK